jgi:hypothetical protein
MNYLYAAYAVAWIIHLTYLGRLVNRTSRVERDIDKLSRNP